MFAIMVDRCCFRWLWSWSRSLRMASWPCQMVVGWPAQWRPLLVNAPSKCIRSFACHSVPYRPFGWFFNQSPFRKNNSSTIGLSFWPFSGQIARKKIRRDSQSISSAFFPKHQIAERLQVCVGQSSGFPFPGQRSAPRGRLLARLVVPCNRISFLPKLSI